MNPTISIIIPVYNCEKYIAECIHSIQNQSFNNFEIIIVNDGSTDSSKKIVEGLAANDKRILLINQENSGPSMARNCALDHARGQWVAFIDADDWVGPNYLNVIEHKENYDAVFFGHYTITEKRSEKHQIIETGTDASNNIESILYTLLQSPEMFFGFTWNKFYKRSIIGKLRFDETLDYKEDEVFTIQYCSRIKSIYISNSTPYNYRVLPYSLSHNENIRRNYTQLAIATENALKDYPWGKFKREMLRRCNIYHLFGIKEIIRDIPDLKKRPTSNYVDINNILNRFDLFCETNKLTCILGRKIYATSLLPTRQLRNKIRLWLLKTSII